MFVPYADTTFLQDPMSKIVISVNLGAYAYCYTMNYFIHEAESDVPYIAINALSLHMLLVLVSFVNFIHFFINGFRLEKILNRAAESSLRAAKALSSDVNTNLDRDDQPKVPSNAYKVMSDKSGYVTHFRLQNLASLAEKMDICVLYRHQIGEFVTTDTVLCYIWDAKTRVHAKTRGLGKRVVEWIPYDEGEEANLPWDKKVERKLGHFATKGIHLSTKRSRDLDVTLGIQQICDVAVRALSEAINDPHTAIQSMDVLSSLLGSLAKMDLGVPNARDDGGILRLCAPRRSFSHMLSMLDSIRRYGRSDLAVCRRGLRLFGDIGGILTRSKGLERPDRLDRVPAVLAQLEQWMVVSKENFAEGTPELLSLQELYDDMLQQIAKSNHSFLEADESVQRDLQDYEITHDDVAEDSESSE